MPSIPTTSSRSRSGPYDSYVPPARIRPASSGRSMPGPDPEGIAPIPGSAATNDSQSTTVLKTYPSGWQAIIADFEDDLEAEAEDDEFLRPSHSPQKDDKQMIKTLVSEYCDAFQLLGANAAHIKYACYAAAVDNVSCIIVYPSAVQDVCSIRIRNL